MLFLADSMTKLKLIYTAVLLSPCSSLSTGFKAYFTATSAQLQTEKNKTAVL